jgi:DNA-binding NtrC family response regulator
MALVIDGDAVSRKLGAQALEQLGYRVFTGESSTEARALAFEHAEDLQLVLYDAGSVGLDAETALTLLGQVCSAAVLLTADSRAPEAVIRRIAGTTGGFLPKPYTLEQIQDAVRSIGSGTVPGGRESPPGRSFGIAHIS